MYDYEVRLFDKYNDEDHPTEEEFWADVYDEDFARIEEEV